MGLWGQTCQLGGATWQVFWDESIGAFVTARDGMESGIAVQLFSLPAGSGISALGRRLIDVGALEGGAGCTWRRRSSRSASPFAVYHELASNDPDALASIAGGEVPAPRCGPYGVSTHGVRYFITDRRWPGTAIFVDEGQERPLFDPMSITVLEPG